MIRRPPRSTQSRSSAASDVYKRQGHERDGDGHCKRGALARAAKHTLRAQTPSTPLSLCLRGELTGSRWKVRYAACYGLDGFGIPAKSITAIRPRNRLDAPAPMGPPFPAALGSGNSAVFATSVEYKQIRRGEGAPPPNRSCLRR